MIFSLFFFSFSSINAQQVNNKQEIDEDKSKESDKAKETQAVDDKITFKDGSTTLLEINSEGSAGSIILPSVGSTLSGNKLYNNGNTLYWGNTALGAGSASSINDLTDARYIGFSLFLGEDAGTNDDGTSNYNVGVGYQALYSNTDGSGNSANGTYALYSNTTGVDNTANGYQALRSNTTGDYNTANGYQALFFNTTGVDNTANGFQALRSNTTGSHNTANGYKSLYLNTTESYNTANGSQALYSNTSGSNNTANGSYALNSNSTGNNNTANGYYALYSNTTGSGNSANGRHALFSNTSGSNNTANGFNALYNNTSGSNNTAIGFSAGSDFATTGSNLTCIGYNAEPTSASAVNQITLGDNQVSSLRCNVQSISSLSDARDKKNIKDLDLGLDFLMKIKPRQFNWDKREWYESNMSNGSNMLDKPTAGFIAQELDEAQTTADAEWLNLVLKDNPDKLEATYGNLLPVMVKAIQEQQELITKQGEMIAELRKEVDELKRAK